ncbi:Uncharacterised protein [Vibrio cholerae]|nr:Uncharacterised protein [Vibrio cholerae]CSI76418.1 Uncharacterised protein [Vibrio cholerae]
MTNDTLDGSLLARQSVCLSAVNPALFAAKLKVLLQGGC